MSKWPLVALLLALTLAGANPTGKPRVAVMAFTGPPDSTLGQEVSSEIATMLAKSVYLELVERGELDALLKTKRLENNPNVFEDAATAKELNRFVKANVVVVGGVSKVEGEYVVRARCVNPDTATVLPGAAHSERGKDWQETAVRVAEVVHALLTGGATGAVEREQAVSNHRSSVKLTVRFNKDLEKQAEGKLPTYFKNDLAKISVTSNESGHLLIIGVGKGEVYQLFPPKAGAASEVRKGQTLTLPNESYREYGYDPAGYELVGEAPSVEHVHVFFCRKPIPKHVPDPRVDDQVALMQPRDYLERFLPDLRRKLEDLDPNWNGTAAAYYYGVDEQTARVRIPGQETAPAAPAPVPGAVPTSANAAAALERGPEIRVPQAVGAASLAGRDLDSARAVARLDAMRNALESALGVMIQSKSLVDQYELVEDKIDLESQRGFVRVDQDLGEEQRAGSLVVKISAWVSISPVVRTLSSEAGLKQLYDDLERPRIVCGVRETVVDDQRDSGGVAETALVKHLKAAGLDVLDGTQLQSLEQRQKLQLALSGDEAAAQWLGTSLDREILLLGDATAAVGSRLTGIEPVCELNLKIINAADARILVAEPFHHFPGSLPGGNDGMACRQGLVKSVDALVHPAEGLGFIDRLLADWLSRPTVFTLKIAKAPKAKLDAFVAKLKPQAVDLKKVTIDMTNPRSYRAKPDVFSRADLKSYSPKVSEVIVESPLRPRHAKAELEKAIEAAGWEITNISGLLYDLTAK